MYRMDDFAKLEQIAKVSSITEGKRTWTELVVYYDAGKSKPFVAAVWGCTRCDGDGDTYIPRVRSMAAGTLDRALNWFESSRLLEELVDAVPSDAPTRWADSNVAAQTRAAARRGHGAHIVADEVDAYQPEADREVGRATKDAVEDGVLTGFSGFGSAAAYDLLRTGKHIPFMASGDKIELRIVGITTDSLREALTWLYPDLTSATGLAAAVERDFAMPGRTVRRALSIEAGAAGEQGAWVGMFLNAMKFFDRDLWQAGQATIASVEH